MEEKIKKVTGRPKGAKSRDCQYYVELARELKKHLDTLPYNRNDPGFFTITKMQLIDLIEKTNKRFKLDNCKSNDRKVADKFIEFFNLKNDFIELLPLSKEDFDRKQSGVAIQVHSFDGIDEYLRLFLGKKNAEMMEKRRSTRSKNSPLAVEEKKEKEEEKQPAMTISEKIKEDSLKNSVAYYMRKEGLGKVQATRKALQRRDELGRELSNREIENLRKIFKLVVKYGPEKYISWNEIKCICNEKIDKFAGVISSLIEKANWFGIIVDINVKKIQEKVALKNSRITENVCRDSYMFKLNFIERDVYAAINMLNSYSELRSKNDKKVIIKPQQEEVPVKPAVVVKKTVEAAPIVKTGREAQPAMIVRQQNSNKKFISKQDSKYIVFIIAGLIKLNGGAAVDPVYVTSLLRGNRFKPMDLDLLNVQDVVEDNRDLFRRTGGGLIALVGKVDDTWDKVKRLNPKYTSWNISWVVNSGLSLREIQEYFPNSYRMWEEIKVGSAVYVIKADRSIKSLIKLSELQMRMRECDFPAVDGSPGLIEKLKIGYKNLMEMLEETLTDNSRRKTENDQILYKLEESL